MSKIITKLLFVLRILAFIVLGISVIGGTLIFLEIIDDNNSNLEAVFNTCCGSSAVIIFCYYKAGLIKYALDLECKVIVDRIIFSILVAFTPFAIILLIPDVRAIFYAYALSALSEPIFASSFVIFHEVESIIE